MDDFLNNTVQPKLPPIPKEGTSLIAYPEAQAGEDGGGDGRDWNNPWWKTYHKKYDVPSDEESDDEDDIIGRACPKCGKKPCPRCRRPHCLSWKLEISFLDRNDPQRQPQAELEELPPHILMIIALILYQRIHGHGDASGHQNHKAS